MFVYIQVLFGECFDEVQWFIGLSLNDQKKMTLPYISNISIGSIN